MDENKCKLCGHSKDKHRFDYNHGLNPCTDGECYCHDFD